jgi:chromosome segregation ATPase
MNHGGDDAVEAQQNVLKLRTQLQAAQKEIKALEERRHGLLAENRRLKGQFQAVQKAVSRAEDLPDPNATEEEMNAALAALETKQQELETRKKREQDNYQRKMGALKDQKERLTQEKAALEQKLKERQKELDLVHDKAKSRYRPPPQLRK